MNVVEGNARKVALGVLGLMLGYTLSRLGFTDFGEVHRMFTLQDLRLLFAFMGAVPISMIAYRVLQGARPMAPRRFHKGIVLGGALFGLGWAFTGACPGVVFAQLGEGKAYALVTLAGVLVGSAVYARVHAKYLRFDRGTCG
jgi:uncharacterized protein